jgi:hypothetical protein
MRVVGDSFSGPIAPVQHAQAAAEQQAFGRGALWLGAVKMTIEGLPSLKKIPSKEVAAHDTAACWQSIPQRF